MIKITKQIRTKLDSGKMELLDIPDKWQDITLGQLQYCENILKLLELDHNILFNRLLDIKIRDKNNTSKE